jgi:3-methyladenine DNA glycosylase AlkD
VTSPQTLTAERFEERLYALRPTGERARDAGGPRADDEERSIGVRMGDVFALAKEFIDLGPAEIERLLESPVHEVRVGAVSVMDWQARSKKTTEERRRELFELYVRRHDRIDTWDLVDRSAIWVVGEYLRDRPRDVLYELARSERPMERRTAILSTFAFIRRGDVDDALAIAELLVDDADDSVHKAVGWMLREVGKKEPARAAAFLDAHAATMPRVMLRYAIEKLDPEERSRYLGMGRPRKRR